MDKLTASQAEQMTSLVNHPLFRALVMITPVLGLRLRFKPVSSKRIGQYSQQHGKNSRKHQAKADSTATTSKAKQIASQLNLF